MKLKMLGTAAHEGWPALFCQCNACNYARKHGGKNVRMRSGVLIDSDIRIDFSPDAYAQTLAHGFEMSEVKHLLISHSHADHFVPHDLVLRRPPYAHFSERQPLRVYGNNFVRDTYQSALETVFHTSSDVMEEYVEFVTIKPFDVLELDECTTVTALPALHKRDEDCLLYLVERNGKAVMYGHDSGIFPEPTWQALQGKHVDVITLDCTFGSGSDGLNHMGVPDNAAIRERMIADGIADADTKFVITHFSHNAGLNHDELTALGAEHGLLCAYDGAVYEA